MPDLRETRVLLIADTHGRIHPEILKLAETVDTIVHAGDIGGPELLACLRKACRSLKAVSGNNDTPDKWLERDLDDLAKLAPNLEVKLPGGTVAVEHGDKINPVAQRHERLRKRYPQARLILYGHSHKQVIDDSEQPWVVNPGAAGRSRTYGGSACILLNAGNKHWQLKAHRFALADWK